MSRIMIANLHLTTLTLVNNITTKKCPEVQNVVQHREMES